MSTIILISVFAPLALCILFIIIQPFCEPLNNWYLRTTDKLLNKIIVKCMKNCYLYPNVLLYGIWKSNPTFIKWFVEHYESDFMKNYLEKIAKGIDNSI